MASLNVPVPGAVARVAADLTPQLTAFERVRERQSLVLKRFESGSAPEVHARARPVLRETPAVEARIAGIDVFADPPRGPAPVVYLAVESPGLRAIHDRLVDAFGAVSGLEGEAYVPHVTLARGGSLADARRLAETDVPAVTWTVDRLEVWDPDTREVAATVSLPVGR